MNRLGETARLTSTNVVGHAEVSDRSGTDDSDGCAGKRATSVTWIAPSGPESRSLM